MTEKIAIGKKSRLACHGIRMQSSFVNGGIIFGVTNGLLLFMLLLVVDFTSPLHPRYIESSDSEIFRLMGKVWAEGGLPYVDYWDHKGPLIFFTNMLGWLLTGNENGVFWIDALLLLASMYFIWRLVDEEMSDRPLILKIVVLWTALLWFVACMSPWLDMTETVCLPFLAAGAWLAVRDAHKLDSDLGSVSWVTAMVLGLGFSAGLLTRLTNAVMVCVFALVLAFGLMMRGLWTDFGRCILGFLGGVLVLTLPFVVYFIMQGALPDMVYGTFLYNLEYAQNAWDQLVFHVRTRVASQMLCVPVLLVVCALISMIVLRKADILRVMFLLTGTALLLLFLVSAPYAHYASVCVVLWPCVLAMILHIRWRVIGISFLVSVAIYSLAWTVSQYRHSLEWPVYESSTVKWVSGMSESVVLYDVSVMAYLRYDIDPVYPLAGAQDWQASFSYDYRDWLLDMYMQGNAEYILVQPRSDGSEVAIQPVLDSIYKLVKEGDDGILVYQLAGEVGVTH